jgi:N-acetylglutamate synthase-like GNAT family acetyltransferase
VPARLAFGPALAADHAAILALHREVGWPGTHLDGEVWALRESGEIIGSAQLIELEPGLILIDAAVVRADARGRGLGTQMLRTLLATRSALWWLECREARIAFYARLGFELQPPSAVPARVTNRVGENGSRRQFFMSNDHPPRA